MLKRAVRARFQLGTDEHDKKTADAGQTCSDGAQAFALIERTGGRGRFGNRNAAAAIAARHGE
jgi:hypothetical protein